MKQPLVCRTAATIHVIVLPSPHASPNLTLQPSDEQYPHFQNQDHEIEIHTGSHQARTAWKQPTCGDFNSRAFEKSARKS